MYKGDFTTANTLYHLFDTFDSNDPSASVAIAAFVLADIVIYKNGSTTQRTSTAGFTLLDTDGIDFDGVVGVGGFSIDLSDNTDAGFYAAGGEYSIVVGPVTIDAAVINFVACSFSIERTGGAIALLKGTNSLANIEDKIDIIDTNVDQIEVAVIDNAAGADVAADIIALKAETVLILADTGTTLDDHLTDIKGTAFVKDTHSLIDIEAFVDILDDGTSGNAKIATDVVATLADTNELQTDDVPTLIAAVQSDTDDIQTRLPAALISGRMDSDVEAINDSVSAAAQLALSANEIENGAFEGTPTTTTLQTDLVESQDDIYIGRVIIITSGAARGEGTDITDYTGSTGTLEVTALANAPAASDTFILI